MTQKVQPPDWLLKFLQFICPSELFEMIEGDLLEQFESDCRRYGVRKARIKSIIHTISFIRLGIIARNRWSFRLVNFSMMAHFFKFFVRTAKRNVAYSAINIVGLALGLTTVLLMLVYVVYEYRYDRFHANADRIYRVVADIESSGSHLESAFSPVALPEAFRTEFPEVERATLAAGSSASGVVGIFGKGKEAIRANGYLTDADFFQMFTTQVLEGNLSEVFKHPTNIVITESLRRTLFEDRPAVGETVTLGGNLVSGDLATIVAVVDDMPANSHLKFSFLTQKAPVERTDLSWANFGQFNYVLLNENAHPEVVQTRMQELFDKHVKALPFLGDLRAKLILQPLTNIHLGDVRYQMESPGKGNRNYVLLALVLAAMILLMACINFTNLATARSIKRAKEIGLRKTIGAARSQLVTQLLSESFMAATIAMALSLAMALLVWRRFTDIIQQPLSFSSDTLWIPTAICTGGMIIAGIISGLYPALALSGLRPAGLVKGVNGSIHGTNYFSKALVVLQFTFSMVIMAGTMVVFNQLQFIRSQNLGYDKENVITIAGYSDNFKAFHTELSKQPGIKAITGTDQAVTNIFLADQMETPDKASSPSTLCHYLGVDFDFIKAMKLNIVKGRTFNEDIGSDREGWVINEEAAKALNVSDPIGMKLSYGKQYYTVIGVVRDFHFRSVHERVGPLRMAIAPESHYRNMLIRFEGDVNEMVDISRRIWTSFNPDKPFQFSFLKEDYEALYRAESVTETLFKLFSGIAILIACVGLLGLSAYSAQTRNKEYSIRRVFGAPVSMLFLSACRGHLTLVAIASLLAIPLGYFAAAWWLSSFAYHTSLSIAPFLYAGLGGLMLALLTVAYQSTKVALARPSEVLRGD